MFCHLQSIHIYSDICSDTFHDICSSLLLSKNNNNNKDNFPVFKQFSSNAIGGVRANPAEHVANETVSCRRRRPVKGVLPVGGPACCGAVKESYFTIYLSINYTCHCRHSTDKLYFNTAH